MTTGPNVEPPPDGGLPPDGALCAPSTPSPLVCLPDGTCVTADQVAYAVGAKAGDCPFASPCDLPAAIATGRPNVMMCGTFTFTQPLVISKGPLSLQAKPGTATMTGGTMGSALLAVLGGATVSLVGIRIADAQQVNTDGISVIASTLIAQGVTIEHMSGFAIVTNGGTLKLRQSNILNNISSGGVSLNNTSVEILSNVFHGNGTNQSSFGAIQISTNQPQNCRIDFNTFQGNSAQDNVGAAISCTASKFVARNNVFANNGSATIATPLSGNCSYEYSIVSKDAQLLPGTGNQSIDPMFQDAAGGDFRLRPGSGAIGAADPAADLTGDAAEDIQGTLRTKPATCGAYELPATGGAATGG